MSGNRLAAAAELSVRALSPGIIAALSGRGPTELSFDYLGVSPDLRGTGLADQAVAVVCDFADEQQATVWMEPNSGFGSDLRRLVPWYSRHGFTPVAGRTPFTMRRHPNIVHAAHVLPDPLPFPSGEAHD